MGYALEHKPDAMLLALMMPQLSGFEICKNLHPLSYTTRIPIFVVSGESGEEVREHCSRLRATGFSRSPSISR